MYENDPTPGCSGDYIVDLSAQAGSGSVFPQGGFISVEGHSSDGIRVWQAWSLAASKKTPGTIYYAFHDKNFVYDGYDVYLSRSDNHGENGSWHGPYPIADHGYDNDTDQFSPAISLTEDDTIFVSYYDRQFDHLGKHNYYIWPRYAVSLDKGTTFSTHGGIPPVTPMDPMQLPEHCNDGSLFLGDYHESRGAGLHTHLIISTAPIGSSPGTAELWQAFMSPWVYTWL